VDGTLKDMKKSGWKEIPFDFAQGKQKPKLGCVILWENQRGHEHLGFYIGEESAISHRLEKRMPIEHYWTYGVDKNGNPKRKIISLYWNNKLS
jgi:hypothetical protein